MTIRTPPNGLQENLGDPSAEAEGAQGYLPLGDEPPVGAAAALVVPASVLTQQAAMPQSHTARLDVSEEQRSRDRSNCRRQATSLIKEFEDLRRSSTPDPDDLAWIVERAERLAVVLLDIRNRAEGVDPSSSHQDQLEAVIFKGRGCLPIWKTFDRLLSHPL